MSSLKEVVETLKTFFQTRFMFPRLMTRAESDRLQDYDTLQGNLNSLRLVLDTQERALDEAHRQLDAQAEGRKQLQSEYAQLEGRLAQSASGGNDAVVLDVFKKIQSVAVQLPTIRASAARGAAVGTDDVLGVVAPLETMLRDLGFVMIGEASQNVSFDPRLHQASGVAGPGPAEGESVQVRYVGYRYKEQIVCKAEVTRLEQVESA